MFARRSHSGKPGEAEELLKNSAETTSKKSAEKLKSSDGKEVGGPRRGSKSPKKNPNYSSGPLPSGNEKDFARRSGRGRHLSRRARRGSGRRRSRRKTPWLLLWTRHKKRAKYRRRSQVLRMWRRGSRLRRNGYSLRYPKGTPRNFAWLCVIFERF